MNNGLPGSVLPPRFRVQQLSTFENSNHLEVKFSLYVQYLTTVKHEKETSNSTNQDVSQLSGHYIGLVISGLLFVNYSYVSLCYTTVDNDYNDAILAAYLLDTILK